MEKVNIFKKIRVVPKEHDFVKTMLSLKTHSSPPRYIYSEYPIERIRERYASELDSAEERFIRMLFTIQNEFPHLRSLDPLYTRLLGLRFDENDYYSARREVVISAVHMIGRTSMEYQRLINKSDSLDECKSLKTTGLACIFTIAERCLPCLEYLEKIRVYMAGLPDDFTGLPDDFEDLEKTVVSFSMMYYDSSHERLTDTCSIYGNVVDYIDPETLAWLEELENAHGLRVRDVLEVPSAQLAQTHLSLPLPSAQPSHTHLSLPFCFRVCYS